MNPLVSFIMQRHAPCESEYCTTCGGISHFFYDLSKAFEDKASIAVHLKLISGQDAIDLEEKANAIRQILLRMAANERSTVLRHWMLGLPDDPDLATGILSWTNAGRTLTDHELELVLAAATPKLLRTRAIRNTLRWALAPGIHLPSPLVAALRRDEESDQRRGQRRSAEEAKRREDRQSYFRALAELPFKERVEAIVNDKSIKWHDWSPSWNQCNDAEIEKLDAVGVQSLIDLCEANHRQSWPLRKLYDRRHRLRQSAMEGMRQQYALLSKHDQLTALAMNPTVPLEHYPVELAAEVTDQWLQSIPAAARVRFEDLLGKSKLRVWIRARRRLSE